MPTDPGENIGIRLPALPYDENEKGLAALVGAVVNGGDVVGYLPLKVTDNTDGTASLHVRVDGLVFDPDIDIGDVHLLNLANAKIDPATEQKQDDIITRLTTLNGLVATEATLAGITTPSDTQPTQETQPTSSTVTPVTASATVVTLLAANSNRRMAMVANNTLNKKLFLKLGSGASTTSFTVILDKSDYYELPEPVYTGIITGIWETAPTGNALVTELI